MALHNDVGKIGEKLVKTFLMKQGYDVLDQNYHIPYGELDIVAKKDSKIHFVEVKTIKVRDVSDISFLKVRPEDNLTSSKYSKLKITVEAYLQNRGVSRDIRYQIDLACVYVNVEQREGRVRILPNIIVE